jgi:hypothetical protein
MRIGGEYLKSVIAAGAIAGLVSGIVGNIFAFIGVSSGLMASPPGSTSTAVLMMIVLAIIWGAILSMFYQRFHDGIPGKGIMKGLYFGLMIWLVKDIAAGSFVGLINMATSLAVALIYIGFFMWISYGYVLSTLYKK